MVDPVGYALGIVKVRPSIMGIMVEQIKVQKSFSYNFIQFLSNNSCYLLGPGASPQNSITVFQKGTKSLLFCFKS